MKRDISSIDFNSIKQNLVNFLKSQSKFSGYNFEGSALNILLDVLAYNTYYQSFYNNMVFNEMFLDSATKRSSVVSIAKMLGYTPKSAKSATCIVEITCLPEDLPITQIVPKYTKLKSLSSGEEIIFTLLDDITLAPSEFGLTGSITKYSTGAIEIKQGERQELSFIYDIGNPFQKFVLPFDNIDISTLSVSVQENEYDTSGIDDEWEEATDITQIKEDSTSYFIEENSDGYYQVYFGDGVLGKALKDGNKITINFLVTTPLNSNGIGIENSTSTFTVQDINDLSCKVLIPSFGGEQKETKNSIKLNATRSFTSQERAVTLNDYKNIISKDFSNIKSITAWGGETNNPPRYGYVYLSLKPYDDTFLSAEQKDSLQKYLIQNRCVAGITPIIVDPEVLYLNLTLNAILENKFLKKPATTIIEKVRKQILQFFDLNLGIFDADFYPNELISEIDDLDKSVTSIDLKVKMEKRIQPDFTNVIEYNIKFKNAILNNQNCDANSITSTGFYYNDSLLGNILCQLEDDGNGNMNVIYTNNENEKQVIDTVGTVNYETGNIVIDNFLPTALVDDNLLSIYALPKYSDIFSTQNDFILLDNSDPNSIEIEYSTR
jgi:hypothetical protein